MGENHFAPMTSAMYGVQWVARALYVVVAVMWLIPDRRIEHVLAGTEH